MSPARPAAGGGRWVQVDPERLAAWVQRFAQQHGYLDTSATPQAVTMVAADGTRAELEVPFPPMTEHSGDDVVAMLVAHAVQPRTVGVLLVRLGGHAAGVFHGQRLVASKVGSRHVQGRSAAGGWSQQRFARRREGQGNVAREAAATTAAAVLVPVVKTLDAVVVGGDRRSVAAVLADARLAPLRPLVVERHLEVPDPKLKVLEATPRQLRSVRIRLTDPGDVTGGEATERD